MIRFAGRFVSVTVLMVLARPARGQAPPMSTELRIDGLMARHAALEGGLSLVVPSGIYMRTSISGASGVTWRDGTIASASRVEVASRFLLDPFRESPYGLSVGGGVGVTNQASDIRWRPYLALIVDLELERIGGWTPAVQAGIGSGARLGILMRSGVSRWR